MRKYVCGRKMAGFSCYPFLPLSLQLQPSFNFSVSECIDIKKCTIFISQADGKSI